MKPVKYFLLARGIRLFLQFGFLFSLIAFMVNLSIAVFDTKSYIQGFDYTIGDSFPGYRLKSNMSINIPDTINYYETGEQQINSSFPEPEGDPIRRFNRGKLSEKVINKIVSYEDETTKISNFIRLDGDVYIEALSKNKSINFFWGFVEEMNILLVVLFFLILIKLVNRYMDGEIFMPRTFKLVSILGLLLIIGELLQFVVGFVNMTILQHPQLHTFFTAAQKSLNIVSLNFDFTSATNFSNIGIGIFIILLSQVLKEAILVKQENELTI